MPLKRQLPPKNLKSNPEKSSKPKHSSKSKLVKASKPLTQQKRAPPLEEKVAEPSPTPTPEKDSRGKGIKAAVQPVLHTTLVLPARPAAHVQYVSPKPDESGPKICSFRTCTAAHSEDVSDVFGEERSSETVPSINNDLNRSQAEARNSQVTHFDSSSPKTGSAVAANSASSFSKTINASQMFSSTDK